MQIPGTSLTTYPASQVVKKNGQLYIPTKVDSDANNLYGIPITCLGKITDTFTEVEPIRLNK